MAVQLPVGEDVEAVGRHDQAAAELLLKAKRELLDERMMGVGAHADHAHSACLMGAAEWRCEAGAACAEASLGSKAGIETERSGHKGRDAIRSSVLGDGQGAVVLHKFFGTAFKDDAIVIDAIAAADNRLPRAEGIVGRSRCEG
jgi:hypothetical protein